MGTRKPGTMKIKNEVILGRIYRIYNDIDDMIYIGSTKQSIDKRFSQHMYDSKRPAMHHIKLIEPFNYEEYTNVGINMEY